ncbi:uncharacterized protein LOC128991079 [Macrosteles quadrilineatus]|uniref:uncharacterized protein LOC128991079 n=1 Tax=Macrosteles quadrilineatus TaxID=74068 RepID=UPI0023E11726|nr:uncharacterized protein LOC128991079 [Macrosteles quadrilineatus]
MILLVIAVCLRLAAAEPTLDKGCSGLTTCMDYALNVIHTSDRYNLFESLWFDAINGTNHSYVITTSDPRNFSQLVKKATNLFDTHYLVWRIAPGLNVKVFKKDEDRFGMSVLKDVFPVKSEHRTFGIGKRRIMMALLPIMYKLGVITTLLIALTVITLKGLTIGVILLMLSFGGILTKLKGSHVEHPQKDIHIHVHPYGGKTEHYPSYHAEYSPWSRDGEAPLDETSQAPASTTSATWATGYLPPFMSYR